MEKYFYYNTNNGGILPVVMNEDGSYTIYDQKSRKPQQSFTDKMIHSFGKNGRQIFEKRCTQVRVKCLDDLFERMDKADKFSEIITRAQNELLEAENQRISLLFPVLTYAETKAMGCTDIVYWEYESIINPETGNEFFKPEEAKEVLANRKKEYYEKYKDDLAEKEKIQNEGGDFHFPGEIENIDDSCYIWDAEDYLDDLIDEENKTINKYRDIPIYE